MKFDDQNQQFKSSPDYCEIFFIILNSDNAEVTISRKKILTSENWRRNNIHTLDWSKFSI